MCERLPICTIGHSTRAIAEFVALLQAGNVGSIVDIRSVPRSRTNPQYDLERLPEALATYQIDYVHLPAALGGLRKKSHMVQPETNGFWTNQSFHNYADYALSDEFQHELSWLLREPSRDRPCAIMCSEAVRWRCHSRIVTDYLLYRGRTVFHLIDAARVAQAKMNDAATPDGGVLIYPARRNR